MRRSSATLLAMPEHEPCHFHAEAEGEKQRADPDIFRREYHQYNAQDDQRE